MSELDDATKAEISRAVSIVAQDNHWKMIRDIHGHTKPADPPPDPDKNPPKDGDPPPPPPKPEDEDPPPRPDRWWGDRLHSA